MMMEAFKGSYDVTEMGNYRNSLWAGSQGNRKGNAAMRYPLMCTSFITLLMVRLSCTFGVHSVPLKSHSDSFGIWEKRGVWCFNTLLHGGGRASQTNKYKGLRCRSEILHPRGKRPLPSPSCPIVLYIATLPTQHHFPTTPSF